MDVATLAKIEANTQVDKESKSLQQSNTMTDDDYSSNMASYENNYKVIRSGVRKVDFLILSCIVFMFTFLQFDRTSLGNANTDNFGKDIGITQTQINIGQDLFTLGIVLFEIPSNILIKRFGASRWLPSLMFAWGLVTICQIFIKNRGGFYATRFLLASFEAGFIPGAAYYLGQFYTKDQMALRYALLWSATAIAGIFSGILALGLLSLSGKGGLHGWQWLWLIEGVLTCFIAVLALFYLPTSPQTACRRLLFKTNLSILTNDQATALSNHVYQDDPTKLSQKSRKVALRDFDFLLDWKVYGHCITAFLTSVMFQPINTYAPSIIKSLGFKGYIANGLNSVGSVLSLIVSLSLAWNSDRKGERGIHIIVGYLISAIGLLWLALPSDSASRGVLYAGVIVTQGGMGSVQGINAAWLSSKIQERHRPLALGAYVMSIQLAGFVGSNLFRTKDAPRYKRGLLICAGCVLGGVLVAALWKFLYWYTEDKAANNDEAEGSIGREAKDKEAEVEGASNCNP
jgi:MFS family permease